MNVLKIIPVATIAVVYLGTIIMAFVLSFPSRKQIDNTTRLKHIKNVSRCVLVLTVLVALFLLVGYFQFFANLSFLNSIGGIFKVTIQDHTYTKVVDMPMGHLILFIASTIIGILFCATFFSLFWLYQKGIIFSSKNTRLFYYFAYLLIFEWIVTLIVGICGVNVSGDRIHTMDLSPTKLVIALLITIIARIMDEARKMREEQDLTV